MNVCSQYERQLLEDCRQQIANECLHWETEAVNLEERIEEEGKRSADVEIQLCARIEVMIVKFVAIFQLFQRLSVEFTRSISRIAPSLRTRYWSLGRRNSHPTSRTRSAQSGI